MIYTNKAILKPIIIVLSVLFIPSIIVLTIYCIFFSNFQGYIILAIFIFLFIVGIIVAIKEAYSHRNYIKINTSFFEIKFDNLSSNGQAIIVNYDDIDAMERMIKDVSENRPYTLDACIKRAEDFDMNDRFEEYLKLINA